MAKRRPTAPEDGLQIRGFFRVNIVEDGDRIVGDSGWVRNTVVADGIYYYLIAGLRTDSTGRYISRMALGTGTAPATNSTALPGELNHNSTGANSTRNRIVVSYSTQGSTGIDFLGTFLSNNSFCTASVTIQNIMVINDTLTGGTIFAGNTYSSSVLNTNQDYFELNYNDVASIQVPLAA